MSYDVVNGYICKNCTDIDYAKRNIDPQHPKDGPFGVNKDPQPGHGPAVVLGGTLRMQGAALDSSNGVAAVPAAKASDGSAQAEARRPPILDLKI